MRELLYGRNPVYEALRSHRRDVFALMVAEGVRSGGRIAEIEQLAAERAIPVRRVDRDQIERLGSGSQGVALEVGAYPYARPDELISYPRKKGEAPFLLFLDALQDPQNLGTLVRTAEAVGVHGIVIPPHQAARVTPAVVSASSGATEHMRIVQANLAHVIRDVKEADVWVIGLDHGPDSLPPEKVRLDGAVAIVVGGEGQGLRRLVRDSCDLILRLPMVGQIDSLNAAIAGSIALYMAYQARQK